MSPALPPFDEARLRADATQSDDVWQAISALRTQVLAFTSSLRAGVAQLPIVGPQRLVTLDTGVRGNDCVLLGDATAGTITITLPPLATSNFRGRFLVVKKIDGSANAVTLDADAALVDGVATFSLTAQWDTIWLTAGADAWYILGTH